MTSCVTDSDCGARQQCHYTGVCQCSANYGRKGEDCTEFVPDCLWSIIFSFAGACLGLCLLVWATHLLWKTMSCGHKGYFLSTSIACLLAAAADTSMWVNAFIHAIHPTYPSSTTEWTLLYTIHAVAHGTLLVLGALNLSLMWIEFIIASKRLLPVGHNLRLTASFLFWYMLFFMLSAIVGMVVTSTVSRLGYVAWVLSTCVTVFILIAFFTVGSVRMSGVLLREAARVRDNSKEMNRQSMVEQYLQLSDRHQARAENIISSARRIRAWCLCYIISMLGYFLSEFVHAPTPLTWILIACIDISLCAIQWAMMCCISTSMKIDQAHLGRAIASPTGSSRPLQSGSQNGEARLKNSGASTVRSEAVCSSRNVNNSAEIERAERVARTSVARTWSEELEAAPAVLVA
mmetsp:Transcript_47999/g.103976  ORF Transcript_47999/g.103976 Transcript_47999/m.103976 type:complete len:404 (+) Transcript_47999:166-1377(+)